jgi:hypothetical protein
VLSADFLKSAQKFSLATTLLESLKLASHKINCWLKYLDNKQYNALQELRKAVHQKYPFAKAVDSIDPLLFEGRAIMWNRQTCLHGDTSDPLKSWVVLLVLGRFKKGFFFIPRLNLRLYYEPGTAIIFRGHLLPHEVEAWEGGQRVSIVHFTHQSLWDEFGLECP